jgi:hypothetical protein
MSEDRRLDAKALASSRREAMRSRALRIRRSVATLTAALFVATFLVIYVQLASGHDPALTAGKRRTSTSTTSAGAASTGASSRAGQAEAGSESSTPESSSEASSGEGEASASTPSPVTTSQS